MFGQNLRLLRIARGLTQRQLGHRAGGVSPFTISELERGLEPSDPDVTRKLAEALGVSEDALNNRVILICDPSAQAHAAPKDGNAWTCRAPSGAIRQHACGMPPRCFGWMSAGSRSRATFPI